jgi:hypothetical protein
LKVLQVFLYANGVFKAYRKGYLGNLAQLNGYLNKRIVRRGTGQWLIETRSRHEFLVNPWAKLGRIGNQQLDPL